MCVFRGDERRVGSSALGLAGAQNFFGHCPNGYVLRNVEEADQGEISIYSDPQCDGISSVLQGSPQDSPFPVRVHHDLRVTLEYREPERFDAFYAQDNVVADLYTVASLQSKRTHMFLLSGEK